VIPQTRPSTESITDRGITFNYTAVLNLVFTVIGAVLVYLTLWRGATDPVCRMRVDRFTTPHRSTFDGTTYFFCSAGCKEEFETKPEHYARHAHGTRGGRPRGILRPRT
jgi:YHS domain-containing protein